MGQPGKISKSVPRERFPSGKGTKADRLAPGRDAGQPGGNRGLNPREKYFS